MPPRLGDFEGDWQLDRSIDDRRGGTDGRFTGHARFVPEGAVLVYHETGCLQMGESAFEAEQSHLWRTDGIRFKVCFGDGRPFHDFEAGIQTPVARHHCSPDLYVVRYDFTAWPNWVAEWTVTGPRKDYVMVSRYTRSRNALAAGKDRSAA